MKLKRDTIRIELSPTMEFSTIVLATNQLELYFSWIFQKFWYERIRIKFLMSWNFQKFDFNQSVLCLYYSGFFKTFDINLSESSFYFRQIFNRSHIKQLGLGFTSHGFCKWFIPTNQNQVLNVMELSTVLISTNQFRALLDMESL